MRSTVLKSGFAALALAVLSVTGAHAQDEELPTREPADGIAILDCDPGRPAPEDSCLLRIPPRYERDRIRSTESNSLTFARPGNDAFPEGVTFSSTIVLIDLTPGPGGARRASFPLERRLILEFIDGLPEGESIAVYGFNETFERLADFTTDRAEVRGVIENLSLRGTNTRIATYLSDAIRILEQQENALLKHIVLVTDGDEEGIGAAEEVNAAAVEANVSVSALGMFWRPVGARQTATGMDYLERLTEGSLGSAAMVQLGRPADAEEAVAAFVQDMRTTREGSGLILPVGDPVAATITVTVKEPALGRPGEFEDRELRVRFVPTAAAAAADAAAPEDEEAMLFGYPALWVYAAAAGLLLALLLIAFVLLRGRGGAQADDDGAFDDEAVAEGVPDATDTALSAAPPREPPAAYLVRMDTGDRIPISGTRISIGRGSGNAIVVVHDSISRVHAELFRNRDGGYSLTDMDSLNGTFVNESKIKGSRPLSPGDVLAFGEVKARFVLP